MDNTGLLTLAQGASITLDRDATLFVIAQGTANFDVELYRRGMLIFSGSDVPVGARLRTEEGITRAVVRNATASPADVDVYLTRGDVDIQVTKTFEVLVKNTLAEPVPVTHTGDVNLTADNVKLTLGGTITDAAPVAVGDTATLIAAASATRRALRLRNTSTTDNVALISATGTFDNAAVMLEPGDSWNETDAPGAAWYAICDTGASADINVQEIAL